MIVICFNSSAKPQILLLSSCRRILDYDVAKVIEVRTRESVDMNRNSGVMGQRLPGLNIMHTN